MTKSNFIDVLNFIFFPVKYDSFLSQIFSVCKLMHLHLKKKNKFKYTKLTV